MATYYVKCPAWQPTNEPALTAPDEATLANLLTTHLGNAHNPPSGWIPDYCHSYCHSLPTGGYTVECVGGDVWLTASTINGLAPLLENHLNQTHPNNTWEPLYCHSNAGIRFP
jgi:hypothetical protein